MVIQHNLLAMNAQRQYKVNTDIKRKSTEKLSSGYRINRASDDAAGLAISEKMRFMIRGLNQGVDNAQNGISFCQVADGAMEEMEDMIHRLNELSVKSANGTNTDSDRDAINQETNRLLSEIDRISESTEFNTIKVFQGNKKEYTETITKRIPIVVMERHTQWEYDNGKISYKGIGDLIGWDHVSADAANRVAINGDNWVASGSYRYNCRKYDGNNNGIDSYFYYQQDLLDKLSSLTGQEVNKHSSSIGTETLYSDKLKLELNYNKYDYSGTPVLSEFMLYEYDDNNKLVSTEKGAIWGEQNLTTLPQPGIPGPIFDTFEQPSYYAAWIDFSGLGSDYETEQLIGGGIMIDCKQGCAKHYNILFTNETCRDTVDGVNFEYDHLYQEVVKINISNCKSGEDVVKSIMVASNNSPYMINHWQQVAYDKNNPSTIYIYDNVPTHRPDTFFPYARDREGFIIAPKTVGYNDIEETITKYDTEPRELWIQMGDPAQNGFYIHHPYVDTEVLGIRDIDLSTETGAKYAIEKCNSALKYLNNQRSCTGAEQNKLEHGVLINQNTSENTQAAESRIRDTDMAKEMIRFSMQNILLQAGEAMMAQANQNPQSILSLLS